MQNFKRKMATESTEVKDEEFGHRKKRRSISILKNQPVPTVGIENQDPTTTITKKIRRVSWAEKRSVKLYEIENGSHAISDPDFDKCKEQTSSSIMSLCSHVQSTVSDKSGCTETHTTHMTTETMSICRTETPEVDATVDFLLNNVLVLNSQPTAPAQIPVEAESPVLIQDYHDLRSRKKKTASVMEISDEKSINVKKLWQSMQIEPADDEEDDGGDVDQVDADIGEEAKDIDMEIVSDQLVLEDDHLISFQCEKVKSPEKIVAVTKKKEKLPGFKKFGPFIEKIWIECRKNSESDWAKISADSPSDIEERMHKELTDLKNILSKLISSVSSSSDEREELKTKISEISADMEVLEDLSQNEINKYFSHKQKLEKLNVQQQKNLKEKTKLQHELIRKNIEMMCVKQKIAEKSARDVHETLIRREFYAADEKDPSSKKFQKIAEEFLPWKLLTSSNRRRTFRCWRFLLIVDRLENNESNLKIEIDPVDYCTEKERKYLFRPFYEEVITKKLSKMCSKHSSTEDELISFLHESAKLILHSEAVYRCLLEIFLMFYDVTYADSKITVKFYPKRTSVKTEITLQLDIFTYPKCEIKLFEVKGGCCDTISQRLQEAKENSSAPLKIICEFFQNFIVRKH